MTDKSGQLTITVECSGRDGCVVVNCQAETNYLREMNYASIPAILDRYMKLWFSASKSIFKTKIIKNENSKINLSVNRNRN